MSLTLNKCEIYRRASIRWRCKVGCHAVIWFTWIRSIDSSSSGKSSRNPNSANGDVSISSTSPAGWFYLAVYDESHRCRCLHYEGKKRICCSRNESWRTAWMCCRSVFETWSRPSRGTIHAHTALHLPWVDVAVQMRRQLAGKRRKATRQRQLLSVRQNRHNNNSTLRAIRCRNKWADLT